MIHNEIMDRRKVGPRYWNGTYLRFVSSICMGGSWKCWQCWCNYYQAAMRASMLSLNNEMRPLCPELQQSAAHSINFTAK